jgi:hypothetical protein
MVIAVIITPIIAPIMEIVTVAVGAESTAIPVTIAIARIMIWRNDYRCRSSVRNRSVGNDILTSDEKQWQQKCKKQQGIAKRVHEL